MTNLRNSVRLIGRLGKDPETTIFDNGKTKVRFSMATSERCSVGLARGLTYSVLLSLTVGSA